MLDEDGDVILPEFVHGLDSCGLKERVKSILNEVGDDLSSIVSISMDGSAFDSNQHY